MNKEFWILVIDVVLSAVAYFGAKYLVPDLFADVQFVELAKQPIIIAIVGKMYADRKTAEIQATIRGV